MNILRSFVWWPFLLIYYCLSYHLSLSHLYRKGFYSILYFIYSFGQIYNHFVSYYYFGQIGVIQFGFAKICAMCDHCLSYPSYSTIDFLEINRNANCMCLCYFLFVHLFVMLQYYPFIFRLLSLDHLVHFKNLSF